MPKRTTQSKRSQSKGNVIFAERFARRQSAVSGGDGTPPRTDSQVFDYSRLSGSIATFLRNQADRINQTSSKSVIQIGKDLIAAKRYLAHGAFVAWVKCEAGIPARTAQAYMHVANWAANKSPSVTRLPPSILYVISARSAPEQLVQQLLERMAAGERVTARDIRQEIKSTRHNVGSGDRPDVDASLSDCTVEAPSAVPVRVPEHDLSLARAVDILARGLSASDFIRVRQIMTSSVVVEDPELAQKIVEAFVNAAKPMSQRVDQHREVAA
jgi:hypothetical protein